MTPLLCPFYCFAPYYLFYPLVAFNLSLFFFFLMIRRPPRSTLFPTRRSSDLVSRPRALSWLVYSTSRIEFLVTRPISRDRKSTRLNSSHGYISYAVFCLKKKKKKTRR